jgi:hypothetical protein
MLQLRGSVCCDLRQLARTLNDVEKAEAVFARFQTASVCGRPKPVRRSVFNAAVGRHRSRIAVVAARTGLRDRSQLLQTCALRTNPSCVANACSKVVATTSPNSNDP